MSRYTVLGMLALVVVGSMAVRASTYYVDSASGNDANTGTATNAAWRTLAKVNATTFAPGDRILFQAGGSWTGTLWPKGSGTTNNVIRIGSYGGSARPLINGGGATDAVFLMNQEFWEINDLEVINDAASDGERRGIHITGSNYVNTVIDHIYIRNCYIHNIRGTLSATDGDALAKRTGGIIVEVLDDTPATPTRFNDILIEGNTITSVRNQGIVAAGNRSGSERFPRHGGLECAQVSHLIIRSNTISDVTKNALILRLADDTCLIERNVCFDTATLDTGNTMFTAACDGAVFQYNEGYRNLAGPLGHDGSLYDADMRSINIIVPIQLQPRQRPRLVLELPPRGRAQHQYRRSLQHQPQRPGQHLLFQRRLRRPGDDLHLQQHHLSSARQHEPHLRCAEWPPHLFHVEQHFLHRRCRCELRFRDHQHHHGGI